MMEQEKSKAFQEILSALQKGQNLDALLAQHPDWADELRPLLEIALALPQARAHRSEVAAMRGRLDARFEAELADFTIVKRQSRRPLLALVASMALVIFGLWFFFPRGIEPTADEIHLTQGTVPATTTATLTASPTMTASPTISPSATATSSPSPTMLRPSTTPEPSSTATASTQLPASCSPRSDWEIYELESGDTLSEIALNVEMTVAELMAANCLDNPRALVVGQEIYVPYLWEDESGSGDSDSSSEANADDGSEDNDSSGNDDSSGEDESDDGSDDDEPATEEDDSSADDDPPPAEED